MAPRSALRAATAVLLLTAYVLGVSAASPSAGEGSGYASAGVARASTVLPGCVPVTLWTTLACRAARPQHTRLHSRRPSLHTPAARPLS